MKKILSVFLITVLCMITTAPSNVYAATKISKTKATMEVDSTLNLSINTSDTITWTSSKKAVATVNSSGKVTAKSEGTVKITATIGKEKCICFVTVVDSNKNEPTVSKSKTAETETNNFKTDITLENKTIADVEKYLTDTGLITLPGTKMRTDPMGALSGYRYYVDKYNTITICEFDVNSESYKKLAKDHKISFVDDEMIYLTASAINGKFVLFCTDKEMPEVVKAFSNFE